MTVKSADASGDMREVLKLALEPLKGRGGGKVDWQGAGVNILALHEAMQKAYQGMLKEISEKL
ncbi:MAG: hypothetical protein R2880_01565 [Deinococcales bacterium]